MIYVDILSEHLKSLKPPNCMGKDKNGALRVIKEYQPLSVYQLTKKLKIAYSTTWNLVEELKKDDKIITYFKKTRTVKLVKIKEQENE